METTNKEEPPKYETEDQFILRLPIEQAKVIRRILRKKPKKMKKYVTIEFTEQRHAIVKVHKKYLNGTMVDLPTIMESNKTINGVHLFKTADICQMLLCENDTTDINNDYQHLHGVAPPLKNAKKRRFRKTLQNKDDAEEAADIEKEVLLLLKTDNEAVATRFEFEKMPNETKTLEETEMHLFGEMLSDIELEKNSTGSASSISELNDLMDFTN